MVRFHEARVATPPFSKPRKVVVSRQITSHSRLTLIRVSFRASFCPFQTTCRQHMMQHYSGPAWFSKTTKCMLEQSSTSKKHLCGSRFSSKNVRAAFLKTSTVPIALVSFFLQYSNIQAWLLLACREPVTWDGYA